MPKRKVLVFKGFKQVKLVPSSHISTIPTNEGLVNDSTNSLNSVFLGTAFLWFGWLGFNGGSELAANARAVVAVTNTNLAACVGGITWCFIDFFSSKKLSAFSFCSGAIAGLVAITPGAGFVAPWASLIFGVVGAASCNGFVYLKYKIGYDDSLDAFGVHAIGGIIGNLLTGIFASKAIIALDGTVSGGGWIDGDFARLGYQIAGSVSGFAWSFTITLLLCYAMEKIPYCNLRLSDEEQRLGMDKALLGESANDYIEFAVAGKGDYHSESSSPSGTNAETPAFAVTPALAETTSGDIELGIVPKN